jgi:hypothetical protein
MMFGKGVFYREGLAPLSASYSPLGKIQELEITRIR